DDGDHALLALCRYRLAGALRPALSGGPPMTRDQFKAVILTPVLTWVVLGVALIATGVYAHVHSAPAKLPMALAISAVKVVIVAVVFMRLDRSSALVRMTALAGLAWLSFFFIFAFAD